MNKHMMRQIDIPGWAQAIIVGIIAAAGSFFWAGSLDSRATAAEHRIEQIEGSQKNDHDSLSRVETKLDDLKLDVTDIKQDVRSLVNKKNN